MGSSVGTGAGVYSERMSGDTFGATRCAGLLQARLGVAVTIVMVEELAARGHLRLAGVYKGWQLYEVDDLDLVTGGQVAAAGAACWAAVLLNRRQAAKHLGIRQADFELLVKAGLVVPDRRKRGEWQGWVLLFRRSSLDEFAARPDIDWAAVRATPRGGRSPLADLAEPGLVFQALGGPPPPLVRAR